MSHERSIAISFDLPDFEMSRTASALPFEHRFSVFCPMHTPEPLACGTVSPNGEVDATPTTQRIILQFSPDKFSLLEGGRESH
jgi:hypothetical protein